MCDEISEEDLTRGELALVRDLEPIEELESQLEDLQRRFLVKRGWRYTCEIGALWMWNKGGVYVDTSTAMRLERMHPNGISGLKS